jgi:hypothetical protein
MSESTSEFKKDRLGYLFREHGQILFGEAQKRDAGLMTDNTTPEGLFRSFVDADPTINKIYTQWLIQTYLSDGFRLEDLQRAKETLETFHRNKKKLPLDARDINHYKREGHLWEAVKAFSAPESIESSRKSKRLEDERRAYAESHVIRDDPDGFKVIVPLTERASCWWGRGTRWCTAARKNNRFDLYHKKGPLIIIVLPGGQKLQMFVSEIHNQFDFMNDADNPVSKKIIMDYWGHLEPVLQWAMKYSTRAFDFFPREKRSKEICLEYLSLGLNRDAEDDGWDDVEYNDVDNDPFPRHAKDRELCLAIARTTGLQQSFIKLTISG